MDLSVTLMFTIWKHQLAAQNNKLCYHSHINTIRTSELEKSSKIINVKSINAIGNLHNRKVIISNHHSENR